MAAPKKARGLGKGLDALFGDVEVSLERKPEPEIKKAEGDKKAASASKKENKEKPEEAKPVPGGIEYIDINDIKPNSNQPRKTFDEEKLQELADSIKEHGLIQPVILRKAKKGYEIVAGERRWRAARIVGVKEVPCIVKELTDEENMLLAIIENMQREDLNPIEEAEGLRQMMETYGFTQEQISKSVGKSRPYIANSLRLLSLPDTIIEYVSEGKLTAGHGKAIAGIEDDKRQIDLADKVLKEGLSVRQLEKLVREGKPVGRSKTKRIEFKNANVKRVEEDLKEALGTKVNLNQKGNKGKIEIEFYSKDELERLIELLKNVK